MTLSVAALWRYPIKTLAGERLETAELTTDGTATASYSCAAPRASAPHDGPIDGSACTPHSTKPANHS